MIRPLIALASLVLVSAPPTQAGITSFGSNCSTHAPAPLPDFGALGLPRIGTNFTLTYVGGNQILACLALGCVQQPVLVLGVSNTQFGGVSLPFELPGVCPIRVSPEIVIPMTFDAATGAFTDSLTLAIPASPPILGSVFYAQWLTADGGTLLASSRGIAATIGT